MPFHMKTKSWIILYLLLYFGVGTISNLPIPEPYNLLQHVVFSLAIIIWISESRKRIISQKLGRAILWMGSFMLVWQIIRAAKYSFFSQSDMVMQYLWYIYYIPITVMPLICFLATLQIGAKDRKITSWHQLLYLPCTALVILFLTNEYHHLAFRFEDSKFWGTNYTRGIVFYIAAVWVGIMLLSSLFVLLKKSTLLSTRKHIWIPLIAPAITCIYFAFYPVPGPFLQLPEMFSFMIIGLWEGCIQIGLIPSSAGYHDYFKHSDFEVEIVDSEGTTVYHSDSAPRLSGEQRVMRYLDDDTVLHRHPISGGLAYWVQDISEINRLKKELHETNQRLSEEGDLLKAENKLREEWGQIAEKNRIYDKIEQSVMPQSEKILYHVRQAESDESKFAENMAKASFLTVYIKRKANLALHAVGKTELSANELLTSIRESVDYLSHCGVPCICTGEVDMFLPCRVLMDIYEQFETLVESANPDLSGLIVHIDAKDDVFRMRLAMETPRKVVLPHRENIETSEKEEDGSVFISVLYQREVAE